MKTKSLAAFALLLSLTPFARATDYNYSFTLNLSSPTISPQGADEFTIFYLTGQPTFALNPGDSIGGTVSFGTGQSLQVTDPDGSHFDYLYFSWPSQSSSSTEFHSTLTLLGVQGQIDGANPKTFGTAFGNTVIAAEFSNLTQNTVSFTGFDYRIYLTNNSGSNVFQPSSVAVFAATNNVTVVPEPSTWAMLALGGIGFLVLRRRRRIVTVGALAAAGWLGAVANSHAQAPQYVVFDLGTLGGTASVGSGINNSGQVTGDSNTTGDGDIHAFLYSGGSMSDLGTLGAPGSYGYGINSSGQVTGYSNISGNNSARAFLYSGGSISDLGTLGGSYSVGYGINNSGQVTGYAYIGGDSAYHGFLYSGGSMNDLGTLGGTSSVGSGINNFGQVTGQSLTSDGSQRAFLYSGGSMSDLGTLGGTASVGSGINDSGQVTGASFITNESVAHAFLYSGGSMSDLGTLGGSNSAGNGINNFGQVTGYSYLSGDDSQHAFLYSGGTMYDLNSLVTNFGGFTSLESAAAINDNGWIVGYGTTTEGEQHAYLAQAVPEPSTWAMLGVGAVGMAVMGRKRFKNVPSESAEIAVG